MLQYIFLYSYIIDTNSIYVAWLCIKRSTGSYIASVDTTLKMCSMYCNKYNFLSIVYTVMYKKGRLEVHRKNEFRKRRAERRGICTVTVSQSYPISIPINKVNLFRMSIPKEYFFNIKLKTLDLLKDNIQCSCILPEGLC